MGAIALREERQSLTIDSPVAIEDLCSEMRFLDRESLRVVLLNAKQHLIKICTVSQGTVNESLAHPREIFKPVVAHSAYSFILVHNHPGDPNPSEADLRLTRRINEASRILQLNLINHVIIGAPAPAQRSYFSFKEGGVISKRLSELLRYVALEVVRQLVSWLVQLDVIRAWHLHHYDAAVFALLDRTSKLRSSRPQLVDRRIDIVAHQRDRVVTRVVVGFAFPFAVSRVHAQLARPRFENEPIVIEILGDVLPPKDIT
jgi:proteasome lid subunit RPN8/RPN11